MESWSGTLTGTHLFWNGQRPKLEAMVRALGDSLMRHMPRYEEWKAANTGGKIKIARDNIHDKAQIAAYRYVIASLSSWKTPSRPSPALSTTLTVTNCKLTIQTWLNSTGVPSFRSAAIPTAFVRTREPELSVAAPTFLTISEIKDQPVVIKNPQRSAAHLMFYPECNDPLLNRYNRTISLGRLANTDITPRTSLQALLNHLSEYCTKDGLMNKLIAERSYSGHEIAHMLFSPRLVNISRTVIPVDCKFALQQNQSFSVGGQECAAGRNVIQEYMERDYVYHNVSYHQVLTRFDTRSTPSLEHSPRTGHCDTSPFIHLILEARTTRISVVSSSYFIALC
ncbi:hypothetical protein M438DRAFT_335012 [Aureobasidium pullulans EXF-150]|uniref:Uncharacterized protein n=1 Tax=Aureobasidium pullulans EXF-150 TaxID=1043002 RepID=A0A074XI71_AURPU|nr:uncharacterized protein M438DRAFT_335012 [Aureobasidium pullulans EXF-150]KEQ85193.1 hypothetical protein M438DRAFT_335012 [Aureobasidium pullulans EXF-150]